MKFVIVLLIILLILVIAFLIILRKGIKDFQKLISNIFGRKTSIKEFAEYQQEILSETPKSVSGMTKLMEPQIQKDFPEFNWPQFKTKAENILMLYFVAINKQNIDEIETFSKDIASQIKRKIEDNRMEDIKEIYKNIHIHQTEILNYIKKDGKCIIEIQIAVECAYYKEQDGHIIEGNKQNKKQTKYNIELVYIQDESKINTKAVGLKCPNCGAAIKILGSKKCEYCRSNVIPVNINVWNFQKLYET